MPEIVVDDASRQNQVVVRQLASPRLDKVMLRIHPITSAISTSVFSLLSQDGAKGDGISSPDGRAIAT